MPSLETSDQQMYHQKYPVFLVDPDRFEPVDAVHVLVDSMDIPEPACRVEGRMNHPSVDLILPEDEDRIIPYFHYQSITATTSSIGKRR